MRKFFRHSFGILIAVVGLWVAAAAQSSIQVILPTDSLQERRLKENANFQLLANLIGAPGSPGTVSSVGVTVPSSLFSVLGSPVTGSGTVGISLVNQAQGAFFAGPPGSSGQPVFRSIVGSDLPVFGASGPSHAPGAVPDPGSTAGTSRFLREDGAWIPVSGGGGGSGGSVTSVALALPVGQFSVSGSPVTVSGTLAATWINQAANNFFAGPASGSPGTPGFRAIVGGDLPLFGASGSGHAPGGVPDPGASAGTLRYLREDGTWDAPGVTSVALSLPSMFNLSGSPITSAGTFTATLAAEPAATVLAGPISGGSNVPAFRALVGSDLPVFMASGSGHAPGGVPDPGGSAGTTRYLREDGTWDVTVSSLNGLTAAAQTFAIPGTSGTSPNWSSAGSVHTLNIPLASATATGLISTGSQTFAGNKTFTGTVIVTTIQGLNISGLTTTETSTSASFYTVLSTDSNIIDSYAGAATVALPTAVGVAGRQYTIKKTSTAGSGALTVETTSSQTIDGATTYVMATQYQYVTVVSDGANWWVVASGT